jgi:hypothetical protein
MILYAAVEFASTTIPVQKVMLSIYLTLHISDPFKMNA